MGQLVLTTTGYRQLPRRPPLNVSMQKGPGRGSQRRLANEMSRARPLVFLACLLIQADLAGEADVWATVPQPTRAPNLVASPSRVIQHPLLPLRAPATLVGPTATLSPFVQSWGCERPVVIRFFTHMSSSPTSCSTVRGQRESSVLSGQSPTACATFKRSVAPPSICRQMESQSRGVPSRPSYSRRITPIDLSLFTDGTPSLRRSKARMA